jgi:8-oxo-dGTP diphosphatase
MKGQASFPAQVTLPSPVAAVIAVVVHEGRTLLVRRANPPDAGLWGFPGGKIEYGETVSAAALRELMEETSVQARACEVVTALDVLDRSGDGSLRHHFILIAVRCQWISGLPVAGDDALEARWFSIADLKSGRTDMSMDVDVIACRAADLALKDNVG